MLPMPSSDWLMLPIPSSDWLMLPILSSDWSLLPITSSDSLLYRDAHMTGWAYKIIQESDMKFPMVFGEGKRSR